MRFQTITLMRVWIQMDTATWWKFGDSGEVMITFYIWKVHESLGAEGQTVVCRIRFPILPSPLVYTHCVTLGLSMWILLPKLIFVTQHTVHLMRRRLTRWACPSHKQSFLWLVAEKEVWDSEYKKDLKHDAGLKEQDTWWPTPGGWEQPRLTISRTQDLSPASSRKQIMLMTSEFAQPWFP